MIDEACKLQKCLEAKIDIYHILEEEVYPIEWKVCQIQQLYKSLITRKHTFKSSGFL